MPNDSVTPDWQKLREAAELLEEAEALLQGIESGMTYKALARDILVLEIELLRLSIDRKEM
jgi:hypothetical protein